MRASPAVRSTFRAATIVAMLVGMASLARPIVRNGFPAGHDTPAHVTYTYLFDRAIRDGQFPVRWVEGVRYGYSQPLFNFYQPGFYYLVEATHLLFPSLALSLKLTVILVWALAGGFMFLLFSKHGLLPGLLAASLVACSPYVLLDVYVRAAYPELSAIALAIGLLWAVEHARHSSPPWLVVALALLTCLALMCHLPTVLIFSPLLAVAIGRGVLHPGTRRNAIVSATACTVGAGLAAFYVIPALGELQHTRIAELTSNYFDYHRHFVYPRQWLLYDWGFGGSVEGPNDQMSFQLGIAQLTAIAAAIGALVWAMVARRSRAPVWHLAPWLAVVAVALLLMTETSVALWDAIPALAYLQFPWRFLMLVTVACGALGAGALAMVPNRTVQWAILLAATTGQLALVHGYARPSSYIVPARMDIDDRDWSDTPAAQAAAFVESGYFPATVSTLPTSEVRRWAVSDPRASVTERVLTDVHVGLDIYTTRPVDLTINAHAFPGWTITLDRQTVTPRVQPHLGFQIVSVPPGRHRVNAVFGNTPIRMLANGISLVSVVLLGILGWRCGLVRPRTWTRQAAAVAVAVSGLTSGCRDGLPATPDRVDLSSGASNNQPTATGARQAAGKSPGQDHPQARSNTFELIDGTFTIAFADGGSLVGTYTGTAISNLLGQTSAKLALQVTGGTGEFTDAAGELRGSGRGAFIAEGGFSLTVHGKVRVPGERHPTNVRVNARGTTTLSCSPARLIAVTLQGEGIGKRGAVTVLLKSEVTNTGCRGPESRR